MIPPLRRGELEDLTVYLVETKGHVILHTNLGKRRVGPKYLVLTVKEKLERDLAKKEDILP